MGAPPPDPLEGDTFLISHDSSSSEVPRAWIGSWLPSPPMPTTLSRMRDGPEERHQKTCIRETRQPLGVV